MLARLVAAALLVILVAVPAVAGDATLPDVGVKVTLPDGFEKDPDGKGFASAGGAQRIDFWLEFDPPAKAGEFYAGENWLSRNEFVKGETVTVYGRRVALTEYRTKAGAVEGDLAKLVLIVGEPGNTLVAVGCCDRSRRGRLIGAIRRILLSVRFIDRPRVKIAGTPISLIPPPYFQPAKEFAGLLEEDGQGSIMSALDAPAPFEQLLTKMTPEAFRAQGVHIVGQERVKLGGMDGVMFKARQKDPQGGEIGKYLLYFGDATHTRMVLAVYHIEHEQGIGVALRRALLTVLEGDGKPADPLAGLPFTIEAHAPLAFGRLVGNGALFAENGVVPQKNPGDAMLMVAPSLKDPGRNIDPWALAKALLGGLSSVMSLEVVTRKEVLLGGREAYEIVAHATEKESGVALLIVQTVMVRPGGYDRIFGMVARSREAVVLPVFRKMIESFRRK